MVTAYNITDCRNVPICFVKTEISIDLYIFPISGAEDVLGIQWLKRLGPIITNCDTLPCNLVGYETQYTCKDFVSTI